MGGANGLVTWSSLPCQLPAPPLALFAAHAVRDEFSHATHACLRASRIAALPSELFASLQLGFEHAGIRGTIIMRVYIMVASLALSVIGKASGTVVDTGADAQRYCELFVEGSFHDYGEARSAGSCEGMIETAMYFSPNLPSDVRACPPAQGSILESARVLLRYLDQNPDRLNVPGITLAFEAFRDAWPCQGDDAEPSGRSGPKQKKRVPKKTK